MVDYLIQITCLKALEWNILQQVQCLLVLLDLSLKVLQGLVQHVLEFVPLLNGGWLLLIFLLENEEVVHVISVSGIGVLMLNFVIVEMIVLFLRMMEGRQVSSAVMRLLQILIRLMTSVVIIIPMTMVNTISVV